MIKTEMLQRIEFGLILLLAFTLPFEFKDVAFSSLCIGLFIIVRIVNAVTLWEGIKTNILMILGLTFLYLMYIAGMAYTSNADAGLFNLQVKLSVFLFPIFLISRKTTIDERNRTLFSFILGCLLSSLLCLFSSFYDLYANNEPHFFYERFSIFLHPAYFAMYLNFAVITLLVSFSGYIALPFINRIKSVVMSLFFSVIIILLSSKAGVVSLGLIVFFYLPFEIYRSKKIFVGLVTFLSILLLLSSVIIFLPGVNSRFVSTWKSIKTKNLDKASPESNNIRLLIWHAGAKVVKEHFVFGVGTGDAREELYSEYKKEGITGAYLQDKNSTNVNVLNAHNQFLQTFISIGFIGFILLLFVLFILFRNSLLNKNALLFAFVILCIINFLTESMLERQAGVIFYAFFSALLIRRPTQI